VGETFRAYVLRFKAEFFKKLTADLVKPADLAPEMYHDWGDDMEYSLKLGRHSCVQSHDIVDTCYQDMVDRRSAMNWGNRDVSEKRVEFVVRAASGKEQIRKLCREFKI